MKHTKGKWEIIPERNGLAIYELRAGDKPRMVSLEEHEANAKLIAAAPELLEACRAALRRLAYDDGRSIDQQIGDRLSLELLTKAIKKATS